MRAFEEFIARHACKGAHCAECGVVFTADRGDGKKIAIFPNGAGGTAFYVLCSTCGRSFQALGLSAIPNVVRDSNLTVTMSPYNPANAAAFRHMH